MKPFNCIECPKCARFKKNVQIDLEIDSDVPGYDVAMVTGICPECGQYVLLSLDAFFP